MTRSRSASLDQNRNADGNGFTYAYNPKVQTNGFPMGNASDYPVLVQVKYWTRRRPRRRCEEVYVNKENSDMGLCLLIRVLYLFGTMPDALGDGKELAWRKRTAPGPTFDAYFDKRASHDDFKNDAALLARLRAAQARLRVMLEESAALPAHGRNHFLTDRAGDPQVTVCTSYKFWLDEPLRAKGQAGLNKAKNDLEHRQEVDGEMEYWSENHYIMFASSEYLAGQLWEADTFQPAKEFLERDSKTRRRSPARSARSVAGRACSSGCNNRLPFGWTEFNSSGYYREHLWALLNLVDFALDDEVREKAAIAIDLLLFDVVRFVHKGTMGAAGRAHRSSSQRSAAGTTRWATSSRSCSANARIFTDGNALIGASLRDVHLQDSRRAARDRRAIRRRMGSSIVRACPSGSRKRRSTASPTRSSPTRSDSLRDGYALEAAPLLAAHRRGQQGDRAHAYGHARDRRGHLLLVEHVGLLQQADRARDVRAVSRSSASIRPAFSRDLFRF